MARKMKDSGIEWIGEIPEDWDVFKMFQLFTEVNCKNVGLVENNLLSLSYGKIVRKNIDTTFGLLPASFEGYNIIAKDDIVLRLTDLQNDHTSLRVGLSNEQGIITSAYVTLRNRSRNVPRYLYYHIHAFDVAKGFYGLGGGVRQGLNWSGLKRLEVALPVQDEQQAIANYLDKKCAQIDTAVAKTRAAIEEYKKLKQAIITKAVTKGVRGDQPMKDSGIEWIGEIPENWDVKCLKRFAHERNESAIMTAADKYIGLENVISNSGYIIETDTKYETSIQSVCCKGDIIFGKLRPYLNKVTIVPYNGFCSGEFLVIKEYKGNKVFLRYLLSSTGVIDVVNASTYGAKMPRANSSFILNLLVPTPPLFEQQAIADYLDKKCATIDTLIAKKEHLITELEAYKKSLIYEYVTGKKEVPAV